MLNLLYRTESNPLVLDRPATEEQRRVPPPPESPVEHESASRWPFGAKAIIAVLAVLALAGAVGTVVGFNSGDDATTTEMQASINDLSAERDLLRADRDDAVDRVAELEASLASLALDGELSADELATVSDELANTQADLAAVEADLAAQVQLTTTAVTERDALAVLFPLSFDVTLERADLAGDYDVDITRIYCEGFANCSLVPGFDELTIAETSQGWLRVEIDGYFDAGLFRVDGSLYTVAGSTTAVPACNGVPRQTTVTMTLYAHGLTVAKDGTHVIDDLGASLMVEAPSTGSCPRGMAFYGLELIPSA